MYQVIFDSEYEYLDGEYRLHEVIEYCVDCECEARLYDPAGFAKGWVHANGSYTLQ